jgi:hypothetical protein
VKLASTGTMGTVPATCTCEPLGSRQGCRNRNRAGLDVQINLGQPGRVVGNPKGGAATDSRQREAPQRSEDARSHGCRIASRLRRSVERSPRTDPGRRDPRRVVEARGCLPVRCATTFARRERRLEGGGTEVFTVVPRTAEPHERRRVVYHEECSGARALVARVI